MLKWISLSLIIAVSFVIFAIFTSNMTSPELEQVANAESLQDKDEAFRKMSKIALVLGYTGATGSALVKEFADRNLYAKVKLIGRRQIEFDDNRKDFEQIVVDFDKLEENHAEVFTGVDHVFCCLGTTRGQSGEKGFRKVDHEYVMASARLAKNANVSQYHYQSSSGADKESSILYIQVKGQVEAEITDLGFERAVLYRPAVLMSPNREKVRLGEAVVRFVMAGVSKFTTTGSIPVQKVARAMANVAITPSDEKVQILDNAMLHSISSQQ